MNDQYPNGSYDPAKIRITEDYEIYYWTRKFHCSEKELREAVRQVGNGVEAVRSFLMQKND